MCVFVVGGGVVAVAFFALVVVDVVAAAVVVSSLPSLVVSLIFSCPCVFLFAPSFMKQFIIPHFRVGSI